MHQSKDSKPQKRQVMPVPSCNFHSDPLRFKLGGQQASRYGIKQDNQSSNKMDSMRAGENVKQ
jgi:hypothetical protein